MKTLISSTFQSITLFLLCICQQAGAQHATVASPIDVQHYKFTLTLSDATNAIKGKTTIRFKFTRPATSFMLDLTSSKGTRGMLVSAVTYQKNALKFEHHNNQLKVLLPKQAAKGSTYEVDISYEGVPMDGLIISKNSYGDRTFFGDNWPNRAHHWLPVVDHPSDKATCEFIVIAPAHYKVVANGLLKKVQKLATGQLLTHWYQSILIPTKVMVIGAAKFAVQKVGKYKGVEVSSWVFEQDKQKGFKKYAPALDILKLFSQKIGAFPYEKLASVQSKTRYGGMENASCIFYYEASARNNSSIQSLIAHEIAHQWFGNSATEKEWTHIWLSEGFATYMAHVYNEQKYGRHKLVERMKSDRAKVMNYARQTKKPIMNSLPANLNSLLDANAYQKGSWVLHMLRYVTGDKAFWQGIRTYYKTYRGKNAETAGLQQIMEQASGKKLDWFFKQWLYQPGQPTLRANWSYDASNQQLRLTIQQTQNIAYGLFEMPLDISIQSKQGSKPVVKRMYLKKQKEQVITFPLQQAPSAVTLDPNTWVLMKSIVTSK
ncbi:M1 family metallopeptidase [Microscilla marina]|uniref:Aminopeptidase N n=1 Tax=Microscilla marina ATCC 23134 TaxID=313606 RepID=A1ZIX1_MICM2|nr:M1 family metallopeptidase [Microscilla marina]EAY29507.1 aminopeptidase, putative [Microscilla marina ATCC 23134]